MLEEEGCNEEVADISKNGDRFDSGEQGDPVQMLIHALTGEAAMRPSRLLVLWGKRTILILVDSESSHNFLDIKLARELSLPVRGVKPLAVTVADGNQVRGAKKCKGFCWKMQGKQFCTDALLLPLSEYDLILGAQWLKSIKKITWDYEGKTLQFDYEGKHITLHTSCKEGTKWIQEGKMLHTLQREEQFDKAKFFFILPMPGVVFEQNNNFSCHQMSMENNSTELQPLLEEFADVFEEPKSLPPARNFDHQIHLRLGTEPVNVRSYRYPSIQKDVMEEMVQELLQAGIIQHSTSPTSSPMVFGTGLGVCTLTTAS